MEILIATVLAAPFTCMPAVFIGRKVYLDYQQERDRLTKEGEITLYTRSLVVAPKDAMERLEKMYTGGSK